MGVNVVSWHGQIMSGLSDNFIRRMRNWTRAKVSGTSHGYARMRWDDAPRGSSWHEAPLPTLSGEADDTAKLSREHAVAQPVPGLVSIAGGKYTTYRVMAADTIDMVAEGLDRVVPPSCTEDVTVVGSENWANWADRAGEIDG